MSGDVEERLPHRVYIHMCVCVYIIFIDVCRHIIQWIAFFIAFSTILNEDENMYNELFTGQLVSN